MWPGTSKEAHWLRVLSKARTGKGGEGLKESALKARKTVVGSPKYPRM